MIFIILLKRDNLINSFYKKRDNLTKNIYKKREEILTFVIKTIILQIRKIKILLEKKKLFKERKIYQDLKNWKETNIEKPLMIIGARQIGKTYIVKKFCEKEFKKNVYINLFDHSEIIRIFKQEISTEEKFNRLKIYLDIDLDIENTIIFFDEIQESE